ncbi:polysaccharide deacetylase family protein [Paenibacillus sp. A3]|uniref:polysaccharide deacetylase family protein n=1 Tax=Paenibacillus sp. A3 TaxID=1337054 RepID=UPI0006D53E60|nr:polysaccharide deacetylase family protein [Paenibacillus sp. A3]
MEKSGRNRVAFLTFDDGPLRNTGVILDLLRQHRVKATFFVVGNPARYAIRLYRRMVREGHAIGNHSFTHDYRLIYRSVDDYVRDFRRLESFLVRVTGKRPAPILRFPGGTSNRVSRKYGGRRLMPLLVKRMREAGYRHYDWNVDSDDAEKPPPTAGTIVRKVLEGSRFKRRAVILFHDFNQTSLEALPAVIQGLKRNGFTFCTLSKVSFRCQFLP